MAGTLKDIRELNDEIDILQSEVDTIVSDTTGAGFKGITKNIFLNLLGKVLEVVERIGDTLKSIAGALLRAIVTSEKETRNRRDLWGGL